MSSNEHKNVKNVLKIKNLPSFGHKILENVLVIKHIYLNLVPRMRNSLGLMY